MAILRLVVLGLTILGGLGAPLGGHVRYRVSVWAA